MKTFEEWWNSNEYFKTRIDRQDAGRGWNACAQEYQTEIRKILGLIYPYNEGETIKIAIKQLCDMVKE